MVSKDKKTKITFHSGILTIGGTVIEISYGASRIFFDFGTEYRPELVLKDNSLATLLENRLVPELDIYDEAIRSGAKIENTAVFLSHIHLDHTRMVNYLDPRIPLYALNETKTLLEIINKDNSFILPAVDKSFITRPIFGLEANSVLDVGEIRVKLKRVDHDAYGACALLITTPDLRIAYTGDLRLHGFDADDTLAFCEEAKACDVLLIEGVSVSFDDRPESEKTDAVHFHSEEALVDEVCRITAMYPDKQITFNAYEGNVKRFASIVERVERRVVLEAKMARVLKDCLGLDVLYYQNDEIEWHLNPEWQVSYETLLNDSHEYLWQCVDFDENLQAGGIYLHCDASPLGAFDPYYQIYRSQFENMGIAFLHFGCSGHAFPEDLVKIIDLIKPKLLVPIHSLKPEKLLNPYGERLLPVRGQTI